MAKGMKTGGRQKGTPNKRSLKIAETFERLDCDPIECMVRLAVQAEETGDLSLAGSMYKELAQYIYPKRKAIEFKSEESKGNNVLTVNLLPVGAQQPEGKYV